MEISTTNFTAGTSALRIISMEIVHVGKAIVMDDPLPATNLTYYTEERRFSTSCNRLLL